MAARDDSNLTLLSRTVKLLIKERGRTITDVAAGIGMNRTTLQARLAKDGGLKNDNGSDLFLVNRIASELGITIDDVKNRHRREHVGVIAEREEAKPSPHPSPFYKMEMRFLKNAISETSETPLLTQARDMLGLIYKPVEGVDGELKRKMLDILTDPAAPWEDRNVVYEALRWMSHVRNLVRDDPEGLELANLDRIDFSQYSKTE